MKGSRTRSRPSSASLPEHDPATALALTRSMPGAEVASVLSRPPGTAMPPGYGAATTCSTSTLTVAVPYCDVVGTDSDQVRALSVTGLAARMGTTLMRSVADLPSHP
jgi:hypothetical protein